MYTSPEMGLTIWNLLTDLFDHTQLAADFAALDAHNHTAGQGVQIPTGGIANGAITAAKIASGAITASQIANSSITFAQLASGALHLGNSGLTSSGPVTAGSTWICNPSVTATLPESSTVSDQIIVLVAASTVTAATPVTVNTHAGSDRIFGPTLISATTLTLGVPNSFIMLQANGTTWTVIGGKQDTGWVTLLSLLGSFGGGWTAGSPTPSIRQSGDTVQFRGVFYAVSTGAALGTLPGNTTGTWWPQTTIQQNITSTASSPEAEIVTVSTGGQITIGANFSGGPPGLTVDTYRYTTS